jgi:DNA-binding NtrC family response regulator
MVTAYGDSERTIRAMRDGAFDYLTKPFNFPLLLSTVERAIKQRALAQTLASPSPPMARGGLVGTSTAMLAIWKLIGRAAASDAAVLITGETGTGKELIARAIHDYSRRVEQPFVAVNLAALPPTLLESELFGHEKGAFTGAAGRRGGRFEQAAAGSLFLDEIGDLEASLQTKLLRVLQDGSYQRVGGTETLSNRARVVTATNKPVRPGEPGCVLREDLYYRLAVIEIEVPPLRVRRSDIPLLVAHALQGTPARAVSEEAMGYLLSYRWPGNVRELVHVLQRAAVLCGSEVIDVPNLPEVVRSTSKPADAAPTEDMTLREAVARLERQMIQRALLRAGGNRSEAARQLGIGRPHLYAKMEEYGLGGRTDGEGG